MPSSKNFRLLSLSAAIVIVLTASIAHAAWTGPTAAAPGGNTPAPVNVGATSQVKSGGFWAASVGSDSGYCIGASCVTAWPASQWTTGGTSIYYNGGNVGVGTASPSAKLESFGSGPGLYLNQTSAADLYIRYHVPGVRWWTLGPKANGDFWFSNTSDHTGSVPFAITSGGNVGIGTISPSAALHIAGDGTTSWPNAAIKFSNTGTGGRVYSIGSRSSGQFVLGDETAGAARLTVDNSGNFTIGANLTVGGTVTSPQYCIGASCITAWPGGSGFTGSGTANYLTKFTGATVLGNSMIFDNGTNVGIGNSAPAHKLDVTGNTRSSGEFIGTLGSGSGQFRMIGGSYGAMFRNDGTNTYLLLTASGDQYGGWNALRPFYVNDANGNVTIGTNLTVSGSVTAGSFLYSSDRRLKKDIAPLSGNLAKILALQPVSYLWKDPHASHEKQIGFIAQDVRHIIPEIVYTNASTSFESIDYIRFAPFLVGAVQELSQKIERQQDRIEDQQRDIDALKREINALRAH